MKRNVFDSEEYYKKAIELLEGLSVEEREQWYHHPCTKSLILGLTGDIVEIANLWKNGAYANVESADITAQYQALARGKLQASEDVLNRLQEIKDNYEEEE